MRCPSCGTQNEPDSRFCGGCGARLGGTLAPTHKIVDTGPAPIAPAFPPPNAAQQAQAIARQVSAEYAAQRSPSVPPTPMGQPSSQRSVPQPSAQRSAQPSAQQPASRPSAPAGVYAAPRAPVGSSQRPVARSAEQSFQMPKRRWGLIIIVLIFDLGLAAAGAYLLNEGLAAAPEAGDPPPAKVGSAEPGSAAPPSKAVATSAGSAAPKPVVVEPVAIDAGSVEPEPPVEPPKADPVAEKPADDAKGSAQSRKIIKRRKPPKPIDPYATEEPIGPQPPDELE